MRDELVVVSGAAGLVGRQVALALQEAGYRVRAIDRADEELAFAREAGLEAMSLDPLDRASLAKALRGASGVIHAAAVEEPGVPWDALHETTVEATERIAEAAREARVDRFVHISSAGVYGRPGRAPLPENAPVQPRNDRERVAAKAEEAIFAEQRLRGLPASVLRPTMIYGPRSRGLVSSLMAILALAKEHPLPWLRRPESAPVGHHVHVEDVARAAVLVLQRVEMIGQACNVGDTTPLRWSELARYLCDLAAVALSPVFVPGPAAKLVAVAGQWIPSEVLVGLNRDMASRWTELCARERLERRLSPHLDRDLFEPWAADHVYDLGTLTRMGFSWRYPRTLAGMRDAWDWYQTHRWLPGLPDIKV